MANPGEPKREPYQDVAAKGLIYYDPDGEVYGPKKSTDDPYATSYELKYQIVPTARKRKAKAFDFLDTDDTYVQDNGWSSEQITLSMYFIGQNHHLAAERFQRSLAKEGPGVLQLPLDGNIEGDDGARFVLPISYKRLNKFVESVNRTTFEVAFRRTVLDPNKKALVNGVPAPQLAMQRAFEEGLKDAGDTEKAKEGLRGGIDALNRGLRSGVDQFNDVKQAFDDTMAALDTNITNLFSKPLIIASQVQRLLSTPLFPRLTDMVASYQSIIASVSSAPEQLYSGVGNVLKIQELFGASAATQMAQRAVDFPYETRQEAVDALEGVKESSDAFIEYLIEQEQRTAELPLGERFTVDPQVYEGLYLYMQWASGSIDQLLLNLRREATFTLSYPTTPLNIAAEYYPDLFAADANAAISLVERTNNLGGDQIFLLDRGETFKVLI